MLAYNMDQILWRETDENYYKFITKEDPFKRVFFITITTRKRFMSKKEFQERLENILMITNYPGNLKGYIEHSERTGYHFHGITDWKYNHFAKKSGWFSLIKEINSTGVYEYICKDRNKEI